MFAPVTKVRYAELSIYWDCSYHCEYWLSRDPLTWRREEVMWLLPMKKKKKNLLKKCNWWEPAVSIMAMSLDSHVVNHDSHPGPGGLKLTPGACACVPRIPRGEWRRRDCGVTIPPGGWFLAFCLYVSLCLSGERTRPIAKTSPEKKHSYSLIFCPPQGLN